MSKSGKEALAKGTEAIRKAEHEAATAKAIKLDGTLASVVKEITRLHNDILSTARTTLEKAIRIGELLSRVRASRKGKWLAWIKDSVPFSDQTARNYIRVYDNREDPRFKTVLNLRDVYALLCEPKRDKPDDAKVIKVIAMPGAARPMEVITARVRVLDGMDSQPAPERQRRHKSQKQIMAQLQRISAQQQAAEKQVNDQLTAIIESLSGKVRAAWLEFPGRLATHGEALSELAERLQLNTPSQ